MKTRRVSKNAMAAPGTRGTGKGMKTVESARKARGRNFEDDDFVLLVRISPLCSFGQRQKKISVGEALRVAMG